MQHPASRSGPMEAGLRSRDNLLHSTPSTSYSAAPLQARRAATRGARAPQPVRVAEFFTSSSNGAASSNGHPVPHQSARVERQEYDKFVHYFRSAGPYIEGFRGCTFVLVVPGEVLIQKHLLHSFLQDASLLHGLGVKLVIVLGVTPQIDALLEERGHQPQFLGGYRVTDEHAMLAAMQAAGSARMEVEAQLSKAFSVSMVRRHTRTSADHNFHYGPAVRVVSGNHVTGKRRGVVDGVDFGATGSVRFVQAADITDQLARGHLVLLSNLAYSAAGEPLNCNTYDVATHAAIELQADKLCAMTLDGVAELNLPSWLPLSDAATLIDQHMATLPPGASCRPLTGMNKGELVVDLDCWELMRFPTAVMCAVTACHNGVKRAHLVDARSDGGLLLELYTRDGVGGASMISTDLYEGIRRAEVTDTDAIMDLLTPLAVAGITRMRTRQDILQDLHQFTVVQRENKVLACALLHEIGTAEDGVRCGELAAFCVDPAFRSSGRGDSLLDYIEQEARNLRIQRLMLLTTRTADWFEQRSFMPVGQAADNPLLPVKRAASIDPARNSKLYTKAIEEMEEDDVVQPAGKRIGF